MNKAEERALEAFPLKIDGDSRGSYDLNVVKRIVYQQGYEQAEKDLIENKHEKSWRLGEQLWKGIKTIEEASYQYTYDASNDWAYDVPTWEDVQDAFKAGAEWEENPELTWKDIADILNITDVIANDDSMEERLRKMSEEEYYQEVLKRYKDLKEKKNE